MVHLCLPFSPFEGWKLLIIIMRLFSWGLCPNMFIISITILPRIFKFIYFCLIGFWESWLFNYPLNLTIYFPTINPMDWHGTNGVPSFYVSLTYMSNFSSIHSVNPKLLVCQAGYRIWALMVVRENDQEFFLMF